MNEQGEDPHYLPGTTEIKLPNGEKVRAQGIYQAIKHPDVFEIRGKGKFLVFGYHLVRPPIGSTKENFMELTSRNSAPENAIPRVVFEPID